MRISAIAVPLLALALQANEALAQARPSVKPPTSIGGGQGPSGLLALACTGLKWLFTAAIVFSIVTALLAAFQYMRSAGDPAGTKQATNKLVFTAIGVAVAILARTLPVLVGSLLGVTGGGDTSTLCP